MPWTCSVCESEWDNVWQFFYVNKKKLCLACETDLTDEVREKGEFKTLKKSSIIVQDGTCTNIRMSV